MATFKQKRQRGSLASRLYRRVAMAFLALTVVALLAVLYLATIQARIQIEGTETRVSAQFLVRFSSEPQSNEEVPGMFFSEVVEDSREFFLDEDGEGTLIPATAGGLVTIVNDGNVPQPLVINTRLLSEEGVLFRLVEGVTVPANDTVQVEVYADEEGASGDIGPSSFTIPGLREEKQEIIYARSDEPMKGGTILRRVVTEAELQLAQEELAADVQARIVGDWRAEAPSHLEGAIESFQTLEQRADVQPGDEAGSFTVSTIVRVNGLYFDNDLLLQLGEGELESRIASGQVLVGVDRDVLNVELTQSDFEEGVARGRVSVEGTALLQSAAESFSKDNLIGLTAAEAEAYLENQESVLNATVELFPFFVRRIPRLRDHIEIVIIEATE